MFMIEQYLVPVAGYLAGSLASAIIICRAMGLPDPRQGGSGNPGATNVLRLGGKKAAVFTLLGDVLKGVIPVLIAHLLLLPPWSIALTALGAFLGHLYPVFFRFQGGKGAATAFGATAALSWPVGIAFAITWLLVAGASRFSSLASLLAAALSPAFAMLLTASVDNALVLGVMALFIFWRHRQNIARLRAGTEGRIGQKSTG
ncbi:MAG: glycerol-3-phosphate acyltransferase PlsY [Gammaproteobacteria bacterium]|jgi:glycerol-3-phosphate acyltransferase PlsY